MNTATVLEHLGRAGYLRGRCSRFMEGVTLAGYQVTTLTAAGRSESYASVLLAQGIQTDSIPPAVLSGWKYVMCLAH